MLLNHILSFMEQSKSTGDPIYNVMFNVCSLLTVKLSELMTLYPAVTVRIASFKLAIHLHEQYNVEFFLISY